MIQITSRMKMKAMSEISLLLLYGLASSCLDLPISKIMIITGLYFNHSPCKHNLKKSNDFNVICRFEAKGYFKIMELTYSQ